MKDVNNIGHALAKNTLPTATKQENLTELLEQLVSYQEPLKKLAESGAFEIYVFLEIAAQLGKIAEQYHCHPLENWANELESHAKLFDIRQLAKVSSSFNALLAQLQA